MTGPDHAPAREPGPPSDRAPASGHDPALLRVLGVDVVGAGPIPRPPGAGRPRRARGWWRFVRRWGWRAYAIPVLVMATVVVLADVLLPLGGEAAVPAVPPPAPAAPSAVLPAAPSAADVTPAPTTAPDVQGEAAPAGIPAGGTYVERGAGRLAVVDGTSPVSGSGPLRRFVVEVEDGTGVDAAAFAAAVETTLGDPRSWGHDGRMSFQRVGAAEAADRRYDFRVSLVSPGSMERYCPGVGTRGYTSCRYGERAVINLARWETAVPDYVGDVATYRLYVVNHEVGHALGNGHQPCPGAGQRAPVMQQQTLGLDGCTKNAWPYP